MRTAEFDRNAGRHFPLVDLDHDAEYVFRYDLHVVQIVSTSLLPSHVAEIDFRDELHVFVLKLEGLVVVFRNTFATYGLEIESTQDNSAEYVRG